MLDLTKLHDAVRYEGGISRRLFLTYAASLSAIPWLGRRAKGATSAAKFSDNPFGVGVASGDPTDSGVVLWTRLAPKPLEPGGGLEPENVEVAWEIAGDEAMRNVLNRGTSLATPQLGHSVHVEVNGLEPDRWYWYRFRAGDADSPIGRTRTTPVADANPSQVRFAFASCQHYEHGLYTAYEHMAQDELDLVLHLGDYIYEYKGMEGDERIRKHVGEEITSLDDYRVRHAQYKSDPLLQAMHARCPWLVVWDDHEFDDNCANDISEDEGVDPADFLLRRAHAYQAYYENMPLRATSLPHGPNMQLYRKLPFGRLAEFLMLDTRQYRTDQPNNDKYSRLNEDALSPKNSLLGERQREWLQSSLAGSPARWNVLAQQVMMGMVDQQAGEREEFSMDQWTGYSHERMALVEYFQDRQISNPIVLTGDIHSNWVNNLRVDDRQAETPVVATEFVGTSISSGGNGVSKPKDRETILAENPCVQFYNRERGYVRCTMTPESLRADYRAVEDITKPGAPAITRASFVVESGQPGAKPA
jgi:alkaline phosphatase D